MLRTLLLFCAYHNTLRGLARLDEIEKSSFYGPSGFEYVKKQVNSDQQQASSFLQTDQLSGRHLQHVRVKGGEGADLGSAQWRL